MYNEAPGFALAPMVTLVHHEHTVGGRVTRPKRRMWRVCLVYGNQCNTGADMQVNEWRSLDNHETNGSGKRWSDGGQSGWARRQGMEERWRRSTMSRA